MTCWSCTKKRRDVLDSACSEKIPQEILVVEIALVLWNLRRWEFLTLQSDWVCPKSDIHGYPYMAIFLTMIWWSTMGFGILLSDPWDFYGFLAFLDSLEQRWALNSSQTPGPKIIFLSVMLWVCFLIKLWITRVMCEMIGTHRGKTTQKRFFFAQSPSVTGWLFIDAGWWEKISWCYLILWCITEWRWIAEYTRWCPLVRSLLVYKPHEY